MVTTFVFMHCSMFHRLLALSLYSCLLRIAFLNTFESKVVETLALPFVDTAMYHTNYSHLFLYFHTLHIANGYHSSAHQVPSVFLLLLYVLYSHFAGCRFRGFACTVMSRRHGPLPHTCILPYTAVWQLSWIRIIRLGIRS